MDNDELKNEIIGSLKNALGILGSEPEIIKHISPDSVKNQFVYYLGHCCKSSRRSSDNNFMLGQSSIDSILAYMEPHLMFAYNPSKWDYINSLYEITSPSIVNKICNSLLSDEEFNQWDRTKGQWASSAIMYYTCFINAKNYFDTSSVIEAKDKKIIPLDIKGLPLQQIIYGAPGTGKSFTIELCTSGYRVIRTTFHPDSDYSTFVGTYKPSMSIDDIKPRLTLSVQDLAQILNNYYNDPDFGKVEGIQKFCYEYWNYIAGEYMTVNTNKLATIANIPQTYAREIDKYVNFCKILPKPKNDKKIIYKFVPQAFTQAYVESWKDLSNQIFLIVEEINRGNCAQIFGDIFQLLDRKDDGFSCYEIKPNEDLMLYLNEEFAKNGIDAKAPENIKSGEVMCLPPNLHIWATMNTSDQSLFPIDSAFKRRWDWKYIPINPEKENWVIETKEGNYSWSSFLKEVNREIGETTSSEDKKLGFYFCKAESDKISAVKFVSKVLFYVYNDVFKDYGFESKDFFKKNGKVMYFQDYYNLDGTINEENVIQFLNNLKIEKTSESNNQS